MNSRQNDGLETRQRLLNWNKVFPDSQVLATTLLLASQFREVDPSHPRGGPDGGRDALLKKDGLTLRLCVYFPNGEQKFSQIKKKFLSDITSDSTSGADGFVFFTNQPIKLGDRQKLSGCANGKPVEIYHLERVTDLLNIPSNYGIRMEFLQINITIEEHLSFHAARDKAYLQQIREVTEALKSASDAIVNHSTGGDSYLRFDLHLDPKSYELVPGKYPRIKIGAFLESEQPNRPASYPLSDVDIDIVSDVGDVFSGVRHQTTPYRAQNCHLNIVKTFEHLRLSNNKKHQWFEISVFARNGSYKQYFMFKQHRDGIWYFHAIRWNDLHNFELRQEEFQSGYPDELKSQSPTVDECRGHDFNATRKRSDWPDHRFRKTFYGL